MGNGPVDPDVLAAFGATAEPVRLPGGRGGAWRSGDLVLKPAEDEEETRWCAEVLSALPDGAGFRVARPVRSRDGDWTAARWAATRLVPGRADPRRADEVVRAGIAFHRAVATVPRPSFVDERRNPWSYGERLAWTDPGAVPLRRRSVLVDRLLAARRPVRAPARIVHGDLLGNVLFADGLPPAVIDWAPYWRPPGWAAAVVVVDALTWHGAGPDLVRRWAHLPHWRQMLIRASIYRIATWDAAGRGFEPEEAYERTTALVLAS